MANLDVNTIMLLLIALLNFGGIVMSVLGRKEVLAQVNSQKETINKLELNTNSIKDALVAATAKASYAEGKAIGIEIASPAAEVSIAKSIPLDVKVVSQ